MSQIAMDTPRAPEADVERCAEAFAAVRQFPKADRQAVLARYGWDEDRFSAALSTIAGGISGGLAHADPRLLLRFAGAYGAADRYVRQERPRAKDLRPMVAEVVLPTVSPAMPTPSAGESQAAAAAAAAPKLRFVRYDPLTGKLLQTPRWEEEP